MQVLHPRTFSHVEERGSFLSLEYTPVCSSQPADMHVPLRCRRDDQPVVLVVAVAVSASAPSAALHDTLYSISENLPALQESCGIDSMQVAVVVVVDGSALHANLAGYLHGTLYNYDVSMLHSSVNGEPVTMHVFERPLQMARHAALREYFLPVSFTLAVAAQPRPLGLMRSRLWLLSGFAQQLCPDHVVSVDAGAVLHLECLSRIVRGFRRNPQVGMVVPRVVVSSLNLFSVLTASESFTRCVSDSMDSAAYSLTGLLPHVRDGALAVRWSAVQGHPIGEYFRALEGSVDELGPFDALR
jgi:cellulose synthase/poly-beta-1,6-N-acetylglucosamine synthase-like glycosyltransferase